jgi:peptidoglycan-associated lipoprotein
MRVKVLGLMAALLIVAGCTTDATTSDTTDGTGTAAAVDTTPPPAPEQMAPAPMDPQEDLVINVGDRVFFDFDKSDLRPDAIEQLNRQAEWLKANPSITVVIEGHCDERGTREYNLALGERRASAAKQYLESVGIDAGRMETISYGKERPAVLGSNEEAWAQNRRAVLVVKSGQLSS